MNWGSPFCSTFLECLYQRYLSSNISQLLEVFWGIDEQPVTKIINKIIKAFLISLS